MGYRMSSKFKANLVHIAKPYFKKSKIKTDEVNSQLTEKGSKLNHEWGTKGPNKATRPSPDRC